MRLPLLAAVFLSLILVSAASAQRHSLEPGDEVRVFAPGATPDTVQGEVLSYTSELLVVSAPGSRAAYEIPVTGIRVLAKNEGLSRTRSAWRVARATGFIGLSAGAVAGPLVGAAVKGDQLLLSAGLAAGGAVVAGGAGALIGAMLADEHWQSYRIPSGGRVALGATPGGAPVLGLSVPTRW